MPRSLADQGGRDELGLVRCWWIRDDLLNSRPPGRSLTQKAVVHVRKYCG